MLLPMQQFYIAKMLIFTIIAMRSYLYLVCLVFLDLKNIYFKEHPWVIAFKYSICDMENDRNLNYVHCLNLTPMENVLWRQWKIPPWFIVPLEKVWFYKRLFLEMVIVMVKYKRKCSKKMQCQ